MSNQLELQKEEMEEYEEQITLLAEELEASRQELEEVTLRAERYMTERDQLRSASMMNASTSTSPAALLDPTSVTSIKQLQDQLSQEKVESAQLREQNNGLKSQVIELEVKLGEIQEQDGADATRWRDEVEQALFEARQASERADRLEEEVEEARTALEKYRGSPSPMNSPSGASVGGGSVNEDALREELDDAKARLEGTERALAEVTLKLSEAEAHSLALEHHEKHQMNTSINSQSSNATDTSVKQQLALLEASNIELNHQLHSEKEVNAWLRDLIAKVGEKDDATEMLLEEMKKEREQLEAQSKKAVSDRTTAAYEAEKAVLALQAYQTNGEGGSSTTTTDTDSRGGGGN
jgi:chromosome segregation ATPase